MEGKENLDNVMAKGKGVIVIVPHLGNWEFVGATYPLLIPSSAVAFPQGNRFTDNFINKYRTNKLLKIF